MMTTSADGHLDVYDYMYKQNEPALSLQVRGASAWADCEKQMATPSPLRGPRGCMMLERASAQTCIRHQALTCQMAHRRCCITPAGMHSELGCHAGV